MTAEEAIQLLNINLDDLIKLVSTYNISTPEIDALRLGIEPENLKDINYQSELFEQKHSELLEKYSGKWVAFADDRVLDVDDDETALAQRVYQSIPNKPILIKKVLPETSTPIVRTPFFPSNNYPN